MIKGQRNIDKYIVLDNNKSESGYEQCIEEFMNYYDGRSKKYKRIYFVWTIIKLLAIASIPLAEIFKMDISETNWIVIAASAIIIFCESLLEKTKARDKYLSYRSTCDKLMSEQRMYKTQCGYYKEVHDVLNEYVKRIEHIIEIESGNWKEYMNSEGKKEK